MPSSLAFLKVLANPAPQVRKLAESYLKEFTHITIGSSELSTNVNIAQQIVVLSDFEKRGRLIKDLEAISTDNGKVIIFVGTKR